MRKSVMIMRMVGLKSPEEMAQEALHLVHGQGIKAVKLKIGTGFNEDIERVRNFPE